jgi:hypothetical protein
LFRFETKQRFLHAKRNELKTKNSETKQIQEKIQNWIEEKGTSVAGAVFLVHTVA